MQPSLAFLTERGECGFPLKYKTALQWFDLCSRNPESDSVCGIRFRFGFCDQTPIENSPTARSLGLTHSRLGHTVGWARKRVQVSSSRHYRCAGKRAWTGRGAWTGRTLLYLADDVYSHGLFHAWLESSSSVSPVPFAAIQARRSHAALTLAGPAAGAQTLPEHANPVSTAQRWPPALASTAQVEA